MKPMRISCLLGGSNSRIIGNGGTPWVGSGSKVELLIALAVTPVRGYVASVLDPSAAPLPGVVALLIAFLIAFRTKVRCGKRC